MTSEQGADRQPSGLRFLFDRRGAKTRGVQILPLRMRRRPIAAWLAEIFFPSTPHARGAQGRRGVGILFYGRRGVQIYDYGTGPGRSPLFYPYSTLFYPHFTLFYLILPYTTPILPLFCPILPYFTLFYRSLPLFCLYSTPILPLFYPILPYSTLFYPYST